MHNLSEIKKEDVERNEMEIENAWQKPMKCMSKKCVYETCGRKAHENKNNNKYEKFSDEEEKEEEQECHKMSNEKERSDGPMLNENHKCEENEKHECEGDDESFQLIKKLKSDVEKTCAMCENLQKDSVCKEVRNETLVDSLKEELCIVMCNCEDECYLEVEDMMKT